MATTNFTNLSITAAGNGSSDEEDYPARVAPSTPTKKTSVAAFAAAAAAASMPGSPIRGPIRPRKAENNDDKEFGKPAAAAASGGDGGAGHGNNDNDSAADAIAAKKAAAAEKRKATAAAKRAAKKAEDASAASEAGDAGKAKPSKRKRKTAAAKNADDEDDEDDDDENDAEDAADADEDGQRPVKRKMKNNRRAIANTREVQNKPSDKYIKKEPFSRYIRLMMETEIDNALDENGEFRYHIQKDAKILLKRLYTKYLLERSNLGQLLLAYSKKKKLDSRTWMFADFILKADRKFHQLSEDEVREIVETCLGDPAHVMIENNEDAGLTA